MMLPALHTAYVGLGANLVKPATTVLAAIEALRVHPSITITKTSSLYRSKPILADGDDYVNAVVELETKLSPTDLLTALLETEQKFGRIRSYQNAPRTLDCDLLLFDQQIISTAKLTVPHPRMHQRAFVLIPLFELNPHGIIPKLGRIDTWLASISDQVIIKMNIPKDQ